VPPRSKLAPADLERARQRDRDRVRQRRQFIDALKSERGGCQRCGFADIRALVFHHRDPSTKSFTIASIRGPGLRKEQILAEVEKCDLLCANCHMILHARDNGVV
jgi:hypothetical protein